MIGIFDSGVGGLTALKEVRKLLPKVDLTYLADRKNAPYGTKSQDKILTYAKNNIKTLFELGAEKILIACCTASTVYEQLSDWEREISVPIITPASKKAVEVTKNGRIAVIATKATVRSHSFGRQISTQAKGLKVAEFDAQELVSIVEDIKRDNKELNSEQKHCIKQILMPVRCFCADTLILGCTHFPHLAREIAEILPELTLVNPSLEIAMKIANNSFAEENGKTIYL